MPALSHFAVRPPPPAPLFCPARPPGSLPGVQAVQPPANGGRLGRNRRDPPQLVAPATASKCPGDPASATCAGAAYVDHLTGRRTKVIKHDHFPAFLRYNLPPIIRTSPDRAPQHCQCACIDPRHRPQRAAHTDRVKLACCCFLSKTPTFRESAELSLRSVTELFARFACHALHEGYPGTVPGWDSPF